MTKQKDDASQGGESTWQEGLKKDGILFQWSVGADKSLNNADQSPIQIPIPSTAAEDVTADRIQRSFRVGIDWVKMLKTVFDCKNSTGFEYIRLPIEKELKATFNNRGDINLSSIKDIAKEAGFATNVVKDEFKFGKWLVKPKKDLKFQYTDFTTVDNYLSMWR